MAIKPFDLNDLRKQLATSSELITALNDNSWVQHLSLYELQRVIQRADSDLLCQIACCHQTPLSIFEQLASRVECRNHVAENPVTPAAILGRLSNAEHTYIRGMVAGHKNTSPDDLSKLARDADCGVRRNVAGNPNTPHDILDRLARDAQAWVRAGVAGNPNTPHDILQGLSGDTDEQIRVAVAGNKSTQPETLERLSKDSEAVMKKVSKNPQTPNHVLDFYLTDPDTALRSEVISNVKKNLSNRSGVSTVPPTKSGCFIATAATGSFAHPMVVDLRDFRDRVLATSSLGRMFIEWYYRNSPPIAKRIAKNGLLRTIVKWSFVAPLAWFVRALIK